MRVLKLPTYGLSYHEAGHYGYRHSLHLLKWLVLFGPVPVVAPPNPPMVSITRYTLLRQTAEADRRARILPKKSREGTTYEEWMAACIKRLLQLWPGYCKTQARRLIADHIDGIIFPADDYDWSLSAARETAEEIANEYGETGSNL